MIASFAVSIKYKFMSDEYSLMEWYATSVSDKTYYDFKHLDLLHSSLIYLCVGIVFIIIGYAFAVYRLWED